MASSGDDQTIEARLDALLGDLASAPAIPVAAPVAGRLVGDRYELLELIGEGGMGSVHRARDVRLGRDVALKQVRRYDGDAALYPRFEREARLLAAVQHPSVVAIYDVGMDDGAPFLALELLVGETLRARLARGPAGAPEALAITRAVLAGLEVTHAAGIVHRDLKPENVFLPARGPAKLLDFGIAKLANPGAKSEHDTRSGVLVGTASYMSPEQALAQPVDARSDLFALGLVVYELLSGERAFAGSSSLDVMYRIVHAEPPPLGAVDPALAAFAERCLAKAPDDRFASARAALDWLAEAEHHPPRRRGIPPLTAYARSGDIHIAYQVAGEGPPDLVLVPGFVSSIEQLWEDRDSTRFFTRLARHARLVMFDKRNTGLSDRLEGAPDIAERVEDVVAVMDATSATRAVVMGVSEGVPIALAFAARHPERVAALVLYAGFATGAVTPQSAELAARIAARWGTGATLEVYGPSIAGDAAKVRWWARWERSGASPRAVAAHLEMLGKIDVRDALAAIRVPTLVLHRVGDRAVPVEASRYLARKIAGARLVELPGEDHIPMVGDAEALLAEVCAFLDAHRG